MILKLSLAHSLAAYDAAYLALAVAYHQFELLD